MTRRRSMHALLGTLALIAGCSTTQRTEVSGVVRDRATGRAIPGARVLGSDGALARTDAAGRFTLHVRPGSAADVRVSADGHASERVELDGHEASVELAATVFEGESFVIQASETSVLSWVEESWADAGALDGSASEASTPEGHVASSMGPVTDGPLGAGAVCVGCHASAVDGLGGAHAGLADSCLACHAPVPAAQAADACVRCHGASGPVLRDDLAMRGAQAAARLREAIAARERSTSCGGIATSLLQVGGAFVMIDADGQVLGDCDRDRVRDETEGWVELDGDSRLAAAARTLAGFETDGSHGAHAPLRWRAALDALAP
jgi:hypothetical protein